MRSRSPRPPTWPKQGGAIGSHISHFPLPAIFGAKDTRPHADFVTPDDFPDAWRGRRVTIDVEAKTQERAVIAVRDALSANSLLS